MFDEKMHPLVLEALEFATWAHGSIKQLRKYTGEPYITHPIAVAEIVKLAPHTPEMLAAALLHDVREDVLVPRYVILRVFGPIVDEYVDWLTEVSTKADGVRSLRKAKDRNRLALAPHQVQTIKLGDIIHNTISIVANDPKFSRVYLPEMVELLSVLTKGDPHLHTIATETVMHNLKNILT